MKTILLTLLLILPCMIHAENEQPPDAIPNVPKKMYYFEGTVKRVNPDGLYVTGCVMWEDTKEQKSGVAFYAPSKTITKIYCKKGSGTKSFYMVKYPKPVVDGDYILCVVEYDSIMTYREETLVKFNYAKPIAPAMLVDMDKLKKENEEREAKLGWSARDGSGHIPNK